MRSSKLLPNRISDFENVLDVIIYIWVKKHYNFGFIANKMLLLKCNFPLDKTNENYDPTNKTQ